MALQVENVLAMTSLGVSGDEPVDPLQPKLVDAIHLRWAFGSGRRFPWYGYYLFRRPSRARKEQCISDYPDFGTGTSVGGVSPGGMSLASASYVMPLGAFTSDQILLITDDFPAAGSGEMDLRARAWLRFTCSEPAARISYKVGVRREGDEEDLTCVRFGERDMALTTNPRQKDGTTFTVFDHDDVQQPESKVRPVANGMLALNMGFRTQVKLPCAADHVTLLVTNSASPGKVVALDRDGQAVTGVPMERTQNAPEVITLKGEGIVSIEVDAPQNEAMLLALCYHCEEEGRTRGGNLTTAAGGLKVRFYSGTTLLDEKPVNGAPGSIVQGAYDADSITAIEFTGGNAAVVDICYESVRASFRGGWKPVEDCPQPIHLPVRHPNYPASGSLPTNLLASEAEALGRIRYGDTNDWSGARFDVMHEAMRDVVSSGPAGPAMQDVGPDDVPGVSSDPAEQESPNLARFRPMNYLVMGSLYAPIAQMLGLYWADETAVLGETYDYLIVADLNNVGHQDVGTMLAWLNGPSLNFTDIDAWICYNRSLGSPAPLPAPSGLKAYSLPGTTTENSDGTVRDMTCNAGLIWDLPITSGKLDAHSVIMYTVRRATLGDDEPPAPVAVDEHEAITKTPHLVTDKIIPPGGAPEPPADWPDMSFCYIDSGPAEGWYSYRVSGVDIFGRYSPVSDPAAWHQWTPEPDPRPWYYQPALGDGAVHDFAISLLDKMPPPPPTAVEAFALDPNDPNLVRDTAYNNWFATLSPDEQDSVIGLRVRWLWTWSHMRQAPDTREFRVYYHDGQPNVLKGRVTDVTPDAPDHSTVTTTIEHDEAADAFSGCYLRTGGRSFQVTGSGAASPLVLTVLNVAPDHSLAPEDGGVCSLTIAPEHPLYLDLSRAPRWDERIWVMDYDDHIMEGVAAAPEPGTDAQLAGEGASSAGAVVTLPADRDISGIRPMHFHLFLAEDTARPARIYRVMGVNPGAHQVMVDGIPNLDGGVSGWELGVLVRRYELFLPMPGDADREGVALATSRAQPMAHGQVGVTSVDDKDHTGDDPARAGERWGDRTGNESRTGGPASIFRIHRLPPPAVQMPEDSDEVFASKADYHGKAYYTFRWVPQDDVETHIFRAMDRAVYQRDWLIRQTRDHLSGDDHARFFPEGWNAGRRNAAAAELNAIDGAGDYTGLSADAVEVLGRLPGNEGHRSRGSLNTRDWLIRHTRSALGSGDTDFFPPEWVDALKRQAAADLLNAIDDFDDYAALSNDANRVLAGLPGVETAFQQITDRPLPNVGSKTENRLGPDNPAGFPIDPALRAYVDAIDGRSRNKYFYRAAFIDAAQNTGPPGLSSPPVHMPDIMPPRMPVFTKVLAGDPDPAQPGDRKITLRWASNREPDLALYRVYRTDRERDARDIRLMEMVQEIHVPPGDPAARPAEVVWLDDTVPGLVTHYYRLVAVDDAGNRSKAAAPIAARAFDTALPEVPALTMAWVEQAGKTRAEISWDSPHQVMIQRREGAGNWIDLARWRDPGAVTIRDPFSGPEKEYQYRALVRKYTGALKRGEANILEPQE